MNYHVGCGLAGIYAGKKGNYSSEWLDKSDVTDECTAAVAEYLLVNKQVMRFKYGGKSYILKVEEE